MPGSKQCLSHERGLLIARDTGDRDRMLEQTLRGVSIDLARIADLREHRPRHPDQPQQLVVPLLTMNVEQQCARCIGHIGGVRSTAGQAPQQEAVDGAESELSALGAAARARHIVQQPGDFGAREIRVEQQAGLLPDQVFGAVALQVRTHLGRAPVLPDDGPMNRHTATAIPDHRGLALIGDADGRDAAGAQARSSERFTRSRQRVAPDVLRVVLHPAGGGIVLLEFALRHGNAPGLIAEHDAARRGRALIDGENMLSSSHALAPPLSARACRRAGKNGRIAPW